MAHHEIFNQQPQQPPLNPKRVRGGYKLSAKDMQIGNLSTARSLSTLFLTAATLDENVTVEGLDYARQGQTAKLEINKTGVIKAKVQGRSPRPYNVNIAFATLPDSLWDKYISSLVEKSLLVMNILHGELTEQAIEMVGEAAPTNTPHDATTSKTPSAATPVSLLIKHADMCSAKCDCEDYVNNNSSSISVNVKKMAADDNPVRSNIKICKHILAVGLIVSELLDKKPLTAFTIRGLDAEELCERLRLQRTTQIAGGVAETIQPVDIPEIHEAPCSLQSCKDNFWASNPELDAVETSLAPPEVAHALLRRLGPSPFTQSKFPMVGLLATCYDIVSQAVLDSQDDGADDDDADVTKQ